MREQLPQVLLAEAAQRDELSAWAKENRLAFVAAYPLVEDSTVKGVLLLACAKTPPSTTLVVFQLHAWFASVALRDAELLSSAQQTLSKLQFLVEASKALGVNAGPRRVAGPHPGSGKNSGGRGARHAFPGG